MAMTTFLDRRDAGRRLAQRLAQYRDTKPVVLGLPRGGVPVADEVARALDATLDVMVVRKLGAPGNPEFAIGAIAPGVTHFERTHIDALNVPKEFVQHAVAREQEELRRREKLFRGGRPAAEVGGKTVILVDDGLATGATVKAAIKSLRAMGPGRIVLAVPIGAPDTVEQLRPLVDELVCLETPAFFRAVGQGYVDFSPTSDRDVERILRGRHVEAEEGDVRLNGRPATSTRGRSPA
jgi:putative phosphoribosyl transferase